MIVLKERTDRVAGYEAPILRGVWERPQRMGVPRIWAALWLVFCLYVALLFMTLISFKMALVPLLVWAVGHGTLVLLTQWDAYFDDIAIAQVVRGYKSFYDAG